MKFQKKIIVLYATFSILIASIVVGVYYVLTTRQHEERIHASMTSFSGIKSQQFDMLVENMAAVSTYLLSDQEVLTALKQFAVLSANDPSQFYFNDASDTIRNRLSSYYLMKTFYRTIVFNKAGNSVSSNNYSQKAIASDVTCYDLPWFSQVDASKGEDIIIGCRKDEWGARKQPDVISVVNEIQGMDMGYIEVQLEVSELDRMFQDSDPDMDFVVLSEQNALIYSTNPEIEARGYLKQAGTGIRHYRNAQNQDSLFLVAESEKSGLTFLTINRLEFKDHAIVVILPVTLLILFGLSSLSLAYVYLTARYLTRPIRILQKCMDATQIDNMEAELPEKISNDEIESLYHSYRDVLLRLNHSMRKEKHLATLQLQAQFDLLQAQVNPHFIYNVLNVISGRGILSDDETICDICSDLAGMMRYSTDTGRKYATVQEEVEYLKLYLGLQKYRYAHKLVYTVQIDPEISGKVLPKIVLQQIAENSITHGYEYSADIIRIHVEGFENKQGWFILIHDHGSGISNAKREQIDAEMKKTRRKLSEDRENVELKIGGMGLVNTYARLFLIYGEALVFEILPGQDSGTTVKIGILNS